MTDDSRCGQLLILLDLRDAWAQLTCKKLLDYIRYKMGENGYGVFIYTLEMPPSSYACVRGLCQGHLCLVTSDRCGKR